MLNILRNTKTPSHQNTQIHQNIHHITNQNTHKPQSTSKYLVSLTENVDLTKHYSKPPTQKSLYSRKLKFKLANTDKVRISHKDFGIIKSYGVITNEGRRDYNEDRVSILYNISKPQNFIEKNGKVWPKCSFFGLYDGHGGNGCSDFLRDNLHKFIINDSHFPSNPQKAIVNGYVKAEKIFLNNCEKYNDFSGSCAIVVIIIENRCYIANVGDSRSILSGNNGHKTYALSRDHRPGDEKEYKRIIDAGGKIYQTEYQNPIVNVIGNNGNSNNMSSSTGSNNNTLNINNVNNINSNINCNISKSPCNNLISNNNKGFVLNKGLINNYITSSNNQNQNTISIGINNHNSRLNKSQNTNFKNYTQSKLNNTINCIRSKGNLSNISQNSISNISSNGVNGINMSVNQDINTHIPNNTNIVNANSSTDNNCNNRNAAVSNNNNNTINNLIGPLRVFPGKLSVSRTIGDIEAKFPKYGGNPKVVISTPEIKFFDIVNNFDFILIGCDGIFEKIKNKEIIDFIWNNINSYDYPDIHNMTGYLLETTINECLRKDSSDNLTLIMICLKDFSGFKGNSNVNNNINNINSTVSGNKFYAPMTNNILLTKQGMNNNNISLMNKKKISTQRQPLSILLTKFSHNNYNNGIKKVININTTNSSK